MTVETENGSAYIYGTGLFYAGERYRTRTRLPLVRPRKLAFLRVAAVAADHRRPFRAADPGTKKNIKKQHCRPAPQRAARN